MAQTLSCSEVRCDELVSSLEPEGVCQDKSRLDSKPGTQSCLTCPPLSPIVLYEVQTLRAWPSSDCITGLTEPERERRGSPAPRPEPLLGFPVLSLWARQDTRPFPCSVSCHPFGLH